MDDEIKSDLDKECIRLLNEVDKQRFVSLEISDIMNIKFPDLVPFVAGIIYTNFEKYFKDLYIAKGISQENKMQADWVSYWQEKYPLLIDEI